MPHPDERIPLSAEQKARWLQACCSDVGYTPHPYIETTETGKPTNPETRPAGQAVEQIPDKPHYLATPESK